MFGAKQELLHGAFNGICFALYGFDTLKHEEVRTKLIEEGAVDAGQYSRSATHIIVDNIVYDDPICVAARSDEKILVTALWVYHSLDVGMPVEASPVMYRPVKDLDGIQGAKNLVMCLTGYLRQDREDIMNMVGLMGAQFSKPLVANKVTHLICYKFEGEKYDLAKKIRRIKIVNHQWLEDCLKAWEILPEENYSRSGYELEMMNAEAAQDSEDEAEMKQTRVGIVSASPAALPDQRINSFLNEVSSTSLHAGDLTLNKEENASNKTPTLNKSVLMNKQLSNVHVYGGHGDASSPRRHNQTIKVSSPDQELSTPSSKVKTSALSESSKLGNLSFSRRTPRRSELCRDVFKSVDGKFEVETGAEVPSMEQNNKASDGCVLDELGSSVSTSHKRKFGGQLELSPQGSKLSKLGESGGKSAIRIGATVSIARTPSPSKSISPMMELGNQTKEKTAATAPSRSDLSDPPLSDKKLMEGDLFVSRISTSMSHKGKEVENKISSSEGANEVTPKAVGHLVSKSSLSDSKLKESPRSAPAPCVGISSTGDKESTITNSGGVAFNSDVKAGKAYSRLPKKKVAQKALGLRKQLSALKSSYQKGRNNVGEAQSRADACTTYINEVQITDRPDPPDLDKSEIASPSKTNAAATLQSRNDDNSIGKFTDDEAESPSHPELVVNNDEPDNPKSPDTGNPEIASPSKADAATAQPSKDDCSSASKFADDETEGPSPPELMENDGKSGGIQASPEDDTTVKEPNVSENMEEKTEHCGATSEPDTLKQKLGKRKNESTTKITMSPKTTVLKEQDPKENVQNSKVGKKGGLKKILDRDEGKNDHCGAALEPDTSKQMLGKRKNDVPTKTSKKPKSTVLKERQPKECIQNSKMGKKGSQKKILNRVEEKNDHCGATSEPDTQKQKGDAPTNFKKKPKSAILKARNSKGCAQMSKVEKKGVEKKILSTTNKTKNGRLLNKKSDEAGKENEPCLDHEQSAALTKTGKKTLKGADDKVQISKDVKFVNQPVRFILSGHRLQRKEFQKIIRRLNGRVCRDSHQWSYQATHLVVPEPVRRTEKFFAAAASGSWILKTDYLTDSDNAGKLLAEEAYEWHKEGLSDDGAINLECPRKWRLLRARTGHGAFYGMKIVIYGECISPSLDTLKRVVKAGDGTILATSPPYTRFLNSEEVDYAIVSPGMPRVDAWVQEFIRCKIPCVSADYLVEYVCKPGSSLEKHVLHKTNSLASKSLVKLIKRSEEIVDSDVEELPPYTPPDQVDRDVSCEVCGCTDRGEVMLICGDEGGTRGCGIGTHIDCCDPPLDDVPEEDWFCPKCGAEEAAGLL